MVRVFPMPPGRPEGTLPEGPFVLASPLAGWVSKQWPAEYYAKLAELVREQLHMPLVLNGAPGTVLDDAGLIACGEGALRLLRVQRAGKGEMAIEEFLRGRNMARGAVLG